MTTDDEPWHLRKELSIGTILSLAVLVGGAIAGYQQLSAQVQAISEQKVDAEQVIRIEERQVELKRDVEEIKRKVETLPAIEADLKNILRRLDRDAARADRREDRRQQ